MNQTIVIGSDSGTQFEVSDQTVLDCLGVSNFGEADLSVGRKSVDKLIQIERRFEGVGLDPEHPWFEVSEPTFDDFRSALRDSLSNGSKIWVAPEEIFLGVSREQDDGGPFLMDLIREEFSGDPGFENIEDNIREMSDPFSLFDLQPGDSIWILLDTDPKVVLQRYEFVGPQPIIPSEEERFSRRGCLGQMALFENREDIDRQNLGSERS